MPLPQDPFILLSLVNTKLRDCYPTLDALCAALDVGRPALEAALLAAGFAYNAQQNQFRPV